MSDVGAERREHSCFQHRAMPEGRVNQALARCSWRGTSSSPFDPLREHVSLVAGRRFNSICGEFRNDGLGLRERSRVAVKIGTPLSRSPYSGDPPHSLRAGVGLEARRARHARRADLDLQPYARDRAGTVTFIVGRLRGS
jgi:hypothetical protein